MAESILCILDYFSVLLVIDTSSVIDTSIIDVVDLAFSLNCRSDRMNEESFASCRRASPR